jgi:uncharacterized OsmC-like protein
MLYVDPSLKALVYAQLEERGARSGPAERPVTTVKSTALHDLQFRAQVEGHEFISDERNGGHDAGPAPLRYFLGGLMMCHQVWTVKSAALLDLQLDRFEGEISGYNDPGGGFARIAYTVSIDSAHADGQVREVVDQATKRCGVFVTVVRGTRIELTLKHNDKTIWEHAYGA